MAENARQQRMIERLQEDEHLHGDLTDEAFKALLDWATAKVHAATDDVARPDAEVEADVQAIRSAARKAARSGESQSQQLVALAETALGQNNTTGAPAASMPQHALADQNATQPQVQPPAPVARDNEQRKWFGRARRRWGERVRRWFKGKEA